MPIPINLFIFVLFITFIFILLSFREGGLNIVCAGIATLLSYASSKVYLNGSLAHTFGWVSSSDTIVTGTHVYYSSAHSYLLNYIAVAMVIVIFINVVDYIRLNIFTGIEE